MKKSEMLQKLIEIEKEQPPEKQGTITMQYLSYLEQMKKLVEVGDVEVDEK